MIPQNDYYGEFNYQKAYGSNPFADAAKSIAKLVSSRSSAASGGSSASWSTNVAKLDDPEVEEYMSHIMGGQRKTLDDYVARAAGAGIKRGGLNVVGGPSLDSALHQSAMKTLAAGYADRFREAMNYNKSQKEASYSQYQDSIRDLQSWLGLQHRFLTSQADWRNRLGDTMHQDWRGDVDWKRSEPTRELQLEQTRRQMEEQRLRNYWEQQDRNRAINDRTDQEIKWQALATRLGEASRVGVDAVGWTALDDLWMDRLGVQMGYSKPGEAKSGGRSSKGSARSDFKATS
ncbi:MAG: hypothetical protein HY913_18945 [Desulfomonile tiedjei]|nr:hypothetical protein [Desulfomonile tiedjei]